MVHVFFYLSAAFAVVALIAHLRLYRQYSRGDRFATSSKEAYEFVEHTALALWLALGVVLVLFVGLSPWWLLVWVGLGGLAAVIVERLIVVGGLGMFISAGEQSVRMAADSRSAEMDLMSSFLDKVSDSSGDRA